MVLTYLNQRIEDGGAVRHFDFVFLVAHRLAVRIEALYVQLDLH
jgi:hypothetical protein